MSKGIKKSLDHLIDRIEALTPKTDTHSGYVRMRDGAGLTQMIDQQYHTMRYFDFKPIAMPEDDGMLGISTRKRAGISLRVFYGLPGDIGYVERVALEDCSQLIESLKQPEYNTNTTGIISLIVKPALFQEITNELGEPRAHLLNIDFDLMYLED